MGVSLVKGGNISLTKQAPGLSAVIVGLGWDARTTDGQAFDLDASAIVCDAEGKALSDSHFVFFNNLTSPDGAVQHTGDNKTGDAAGDDEAIKVNLSGLPPQAARVVFPASIYAGDTSGQTFGQVRNAYIRVINEGDSSELARYD